MWDVIVVGAGIEGSATAYSLAKRGRKVLVLEQFPLPHNRGSSHGHSRITRYAYPEAYYTRMMVDAFKLWDQLEKDVSKQLYIQTGLLIVGDAKSSRLSSIEKSLKSTGAKYEFLQGQTLRDKFPMMNFDDSYGGVHDPRGGILRADRCLTAFQTQFRKHGGVIHDDEPVVSISPVNDSRVVVKTSKAEYEARSIVIAAGPWTSQLTEPLGLQLPLQPKRVVVWYWKQTNPQAYGDIENGSPVFINFEGHEEIFGLPSLEYPGFSKVCYHGGNTCTPDSRDKANNDEYYLKNATKFVSTHLPGLETIPSVSETCIYTMTPDEDFILDRHPKWKNVIIGAGFSGHGFKLAPVVGEVLADLATNGKHEIYEMKPFRMDRFTTGAATNSKL